MLSPYFLGNSKTSSIPETIGRGKYPDTPPEQLAELFIKKCHGEEILQIIDG